MTLTKKQRDFIAAYVESWHATDAAIAAGYSQRSAASIGSENLKKPEISAAIEAHITAIMPKGEVVQRLAAIARGDMTDFFTLAEEEVVLSEQRRGEIVTTEHTGAGTLVVARVHENLAGELADFHEGAQPQQR